MFLRVFFAAESGNGPTFSSSLKDLPGKIDGTQDNAGHFRTPR